MEEEEQEVIRIFIRCLLKYNWEVNENLKAKLLRKRIDETKYMKESYEEYKNMKKGTFDFKKYSEIQRENKEEKSMGKKEKNLGLVVLFILFVLPLLRVLCELFKWNVNISNETMGFAIIIALMFFFFKE